MRAFLYVLGGANLASGLLNVLIGMQGHWGNASVGVLDLAVGTWLVFFVARETA